MRVIRILIVDDHPLVRAGVRAMLNQADGIVVVGECADGDQVVAVADNAHPDVVLMDMPVVGGADATRNLLASQPGVKVIILTGWASRSTLDEVAAAGVAGCVIKGGDPAVLLNAIRAVAAGGTVWPGNPSADP